MIDQKSNNLLIYFLITLGGMLLFLPFLGNVPLFDWDEINFAEIARQVGLDPAQMLREFGLPSRCLQEPELKVSADAVRQLLEASAECSGIEGFGLLMAEALLALEGAECIPLGTQMPLLEIGRAAEAHRADIVALSFSTAFPQRRIPALLQQLCVLLPATCELWAGGGGVARVGKVDGVVLLPALDDAVRVLTGWRTAHS